MAEHITVSVDPDVADVYRSASDDDRRKLDLLINLHLREVTAPGSSLRTLLLENQPRRATPRPDPGNLAIHPGREMTRSLAKKD